MIRQLMTFFVGALKRDPNLEMMYFPAENRFDVSKLKGRCDIILLTNNRTDGTPDELSWDRRIRNSSYFKNQ